jgi:hypothetical protein
MVNMMELSEADRAELERVARQRTASHRKVLQAKALLALADGGSLRSTAVVLGTWPRSVMRWRDQFLALGPDSLGVIAPGRGRKPEIPSEIIEAIVHDTLHERPDDGSTQWSTRTMAERHGVGKDTVARIWRARNLRPWQVERFKLSNDPHFEEKLVDIVGLYLDPPERAVVLCVDEKSGTQALVHPRISPMNVVKWSTSTAPGGRQCGEWNRLP